MKGAVTFCICLAYFVFGQETQKITYDGNQLWKITNDNKTTLKLLESLERENYLTIWQSNHTKVDAMINAQFLKNVKEKLLENNLKYEIAIENIQRVIEEENTKPKEGFELWRGYRFTWNHYHNLDEIYHYLEILAQSLPQLCTLRTIGHSIERRPIKLLKISNGNPNNKAIFIEGGIHADEWISPAAVTYIIHQFVTNFDYEPSFVRSLDWYFVPVLNPDGYQYSHNVERLWRKNRSKSGYGGCVGVDLNRNFGFDWGKDGSSGEPCHKHYRGRKPFSEPESASVANFFINNPVQWVGYIAIRSYGQYILYPWGSPYNLLHDYEEMNAIGTQAAANILLAGGESYSVGPAGITVQSSSGISMDWARGAQAIKYAFTLKLRDTGNYGLLLPAKFIKPSSEEALIAVKTIARAIRI